MKKIFYWAWLAFVPLPSFAAEKTSSKADRVLSSDTPRDTKTERFLDKLDNLGAPIKRPPSAGSSISNYGRDSRGKISGRVSAGTIVSPGASVGGNSR